MSATGIPVTIDDAELAGWTALGVRCSCHLALVSWPNMRRSTHYRRLDEILPRLRCAKCGTPPIEATLCEYQPTPDHPGVPRLVLPLPFISSPPPRPGEE